MFGAKSVASCVFCEPGFYSNTEGQSKCQPCPPGYECQVGLPDPKPIGSGPNGVGVQLLDMKQPRKFEDGVVPADIMWTFVGFAIFFVILLCLFAYVEQYRTARQVDFYLPKSLQKVLGRLYCHNANSMGLDVEGFTKCMLSPVMPSRDLYPEDMHALYDRAMFHGEGVVTETAVGLLMAELMEKGNLRKMMIRCMTRPWNLLFKRVKQVFPLCKDD